MPHSNSQNLETKCRALLKFSILFCLCLQGYLNQARKRTDMFTEESIAKIFSNIEQIYEFHLEILMQFEDCFVEDDPCASEIGSVFLNNVSLLCSNLAKTDFDSTSNEYNCEHNGHNC